MELLSVAYLSEEQLEIMQSRVEGRSYREIQVSWQESRNSYIRLEAIETCIIRGSLGFKWEKGMSGGGGGVIVHTYAQKT